MSSNLPANRLLVRNVPSGPPLPRPTPLPLAPPGMVGWERAIYQIVEAAFGPDELAHFRDRLYSIELCRALLAVGLQRQRQTQPAGLLAGLGRMNFAGSSPAPTTQSSAERKIQEATEKIKRYDQELREILLSYWERLEAAKTYTRQLGQGGYLVGALTLDERGSGGSITKQAWSHVENWQRLLTTSVFEAGHEPLAAFGHPFLPRTLVDKICVGVRDRGFDGLKDFSSWTDSSSTTQRPRESNKAWMVRLGYIGSLPAQRAHELAQEQLGPEATADQVKARKHSLQATARQLK